MQNYARLQYQKNEITTVDRGKLVVLLYEGAINFLKKAQKYSLEKNHEKRHNNIVRALDILEELKNALNFSQGKEIAKSLNALYLFMIKHLQMADMKNDSDMIQEVLNMISSLNETWKEIAANPELKMVDLDTYSGSTRVTV